MSRERKPKHFIWARLTELLIEDPSLAGKLDGTPALYVQTGTTRHGANWSVSHGACSAEMSAAIHRAEERLQELYDVDGVWLGGGGPPR